MGLSNMPKNTPQIKVSFKIMSVGHMLLLNKDWGCFTGINMLSYFIWNIRIPSN